MWAEISAVVIPIFVNAGIDVFLKTTTLIRGTGLLCLCAEDALK